MNHFPQAARRGFLSQCVLAVLIAGLVSPHSQRTVLSDGTADQSRLLSNLYLSILAMLTFLSKFYERKECGKPLTGG